MIYMRLADWQETGNHTRARKYFIYIYIVYIYLYLHITNYKLAVFFHKATLSRKLNGRCSKRENARAYLR